VAVYTEVSDTDAASLVARLGLGELQALRGIQSGIENTNYFVTARDVLGEREFVLTLFERLSFEQLPFYLHLMKHLAQHGIPVPDPHADAAGRILHTLKGKPAALVDKLEGEHQPAPDLHHCAPVGGMLAPMHLLASEPESSACAAQAVVEAAMSGQPFSAVFVDAQMPVLDGLDTIRKIRALGLEPAPRLVLLTAYGHAQTVDQAHAEAIEHVLIKPVHTALLFDTAMAVLGAPGRQRKEPAAMASSEVALLAHARGARILVVEDTALNQLLMDELLAAVGFVVEFAENGEVAIQKVTTTPYDLVLMDMQMPVMDGYTATREIRKRPELAKLPIIAMTANAMRQDSERCLASGMNDYIPKPIPRDQLLAALPRRPPPAR